MSIEFSIGILCRLYVDCRLEYFYSKLSSYRWKMLTSVCSTTASVKTLLADTREKSKGSKVISMMTGDFLAPYLLSSVDRGRGMMHALSSIPIDYLTWGNHEADIAHKTVCKHVRDFPGVWLNSNMLDHEAMDAQQEYEVIDVCSPDGTNRRKVGLVAVLSDDPALYAHFKPPGAFGGATIDDPWMTLRRLQEKLHGPEHNVDTIIPLQHTYVPDDHKTCREFDFPVVLSGHDHHRVDEVVEGTRLLKPGMVRMIRNILTLLRLADFGTWFSFYPNSVSQDSVYATVLELIWPDGDTEGNKPKINASFVKTGDWEPDPILAEENERACKCLLLLCLVFSFSITVFADSFSTFAHFEDDALEPLRNTELARVPPPFEPLSSVNSRGKVCTMVSRRSQKSNLWWCVRLI